MSFYEGVVVAAEMVEPAIENRKNYFSLYLVAGALSIVIFIILINVLLKISGLLI
jgi:hypothetical protein